MPYIFNRYTIGLNKNGGTSTRGVFTFTHTNPSYSNSAPVYTDSYSYTFPAVSKTGEVFVGWELPNGSTLSAGFTLNYSLNSSSGVSLHISGGNSALFIVADIRNQLNLLASGTPVMMARWSTYYNIKYYNVDGAYNGDNPTGYLSSEGVTLVASSKTGYTFGGWFRNATLNAGGDIILPGTTGDQVRYAKWTPTVYTITYNLGGGNNNPSNPLTYTIESSTIGLLSPTRQYYNFPGWYADENFNTRIYNIAAGSTGNVVVYAKWSPKIKTITYSNVGAADNSANPTIYTETSESYLRKIYLDGFTFTGWSPSMETANYAYDDENSHWIIPAGIEYSVTAHARWALVTYYVYYEENEGVPLENTAFTITSASFTLPTTTRSGYTFEGWFLEEDLINRIYSVPQGTYENKYVFAKWKVINNSINYTLNGGTNSASNPTWYNIESSTILLLPASRNGYDFGGWYLTSNFSGDAITSIATGSTGPRIFYAKWNVINYSINYTLTGGTNSASNPAWYNIESSTIPLLPASRPGYAFTGWFSDASTTNLVTQINQGTTGDHTLYAGWDPVSYTITYTLNGGINSPSNPASYNITSLAITFSAPSRTGYAFGGWFADAALTTPIQTIPAGSYGNKNLYAKWSLSNYNITYNLGGGTNSPLNPSTYTYTTATITLQGASRSGYTFNGWFTASSGGSQVSFISLNSTGNKTLYARWTIKNAAVNLYNRYIKKDGSVYNQLVYTENFDYGSNIIVPLSDPNALNKTKESIYSYTFIGWTRNINNTLADDFIDAECLWDTNEDNLLTGIGTMDANLLNGGSYYAVWTRIKSGLKIGNQNVKLLIGENEVKQILRGTKIIWEKEST